MFAEAKAAGVAYVVIFVDRVKDGIEDEELRHNFGKGADLKIRELIAEGIAAEKVHVHSLSRGFKVRVHL